MLHTVLHADYIQLAVCPEFSKNDFRALKRLYVDHIIDEATIDNICLLLRHLEKVAVLGYLHIGYGQIPNASAQQRKLLSSLMNLKGCLRHFDYWNFECTITEQDKHHPIMLTHNAPK